jgi:hypothetical protein
VGRPVFVFCFFFFAFYIYFKSNPILRIPATQWHQEFLVLATDRVLFLGRHGVSLEIARTACASMRRLPTDEQPWAGSHFAEIEVPGTTVAIAAASLTALTEWVDTIGGGGGGGGGGGNSGAGSGSGPGPGSGHAAAPLSINVLPPPADPKSRCIILNRQRVHFGTPGDAEEISAAVVGGALELFGSSGPSPGARRCFFLLIFFFFFFFPAPYHSSHIFF